MDQEKKMEHRKLNQPGVRGTGQAQWYNNIYKPEESSCQEMSAEGKQIEYLK